MKKRAIGLVVVWGGVAYIYKSGIVDIRLVDVDNIKAGDSLTELPAGVGFERLVKAACVEDCVRFVEPPRKSGKGSRGREYTSDVRIFLDVKT